MLTNAGHAPSLDDDSVGGTGFSSVTLNSNAAGYAVNITAGSGLRIQSGGSITDNNTLHADTFSGVGGVPLAGAVTITTVSGAALTLQTSVTDNGASGSVTKTGTGTLTLSGANTYTGATTVNAGTLAVTGSIVSPVTANAGGTLGGTGTISNTVTVNSGGTLSPGLSPGILNTGSMTLNGGSTLTIEINGTTVGTQYDQVNVTGTVTLLNATLNVVLGFTPSAGQVFTILTNDGTDPVVGAFAGLAEGATLSVGGNTFRISYVGGTGNDVTLTALVVTPFATFTVQELDLTVPPRINDAFALHARFTLGAGSDGIRPWTEKVELTLTGGVGAFTTTIPAGAFHFTWNGGVQFTFTGTIHGVTLHAALTPLGWCPVFTPPGCTVYTFEIAGDHADLTGIANPVTVTLTIGNDSGRTTVQAHIKH